MPPPGAARQPDSPSLEGWVEVKERLWELSRVSGLLHRRRRRRTSWGVAAAGAPWPSSVACSW